MVKFLLCVGAAVVILALGMIPSSQASPLDFELAAVLKDVAEGRIVGGNSTTMSDVPYQVSIQSPWTGGHFCGGSIINRWWILTACHCAQDFDWDELYIVAGQKNLSQPENSTQVCNVAAIHKNEKFQYYSTLANDCALLKLATPLNFTDSVQPIRLANVSVANGTEAKVSGWGTLSSGGDLPQLVQSVSLPVRSDADCSAAYGTSYYPDTMMCAGIGGKDSCQGDSGGPLVTFNNGTQSYQQLGIVSWGRGCADPNYPGVYADVVDLFLWILRTVDCAEKADRRIASTDEWYQWYNLTYTS